MSGFALARSIEPDQRGYGTHEQVGLPPCTFIRVFNVRCPTCGMMTSFAWFVRGHMAAAIRVHPGGCLLAIMCALMIPWCWISAATGRMWRIREPGRVVLVCLLLVAGASLLQWLVRYAIVR